jgi:hypothetical protein
MKLLTALGLTAALLAGCSEPVASTAPIGVPLTPLPSQSFTVLSFATPNEVIPETCARIDAHLSEAFAAEVDWREKRLNDEEFEAVLRVINDELAWAGYPKDSNGFRYSTMAPVAKTFYGLAIRPLADAHLSLAAVISVGVSDYRFVKAHLKEAKKLSREWMDFYCDDSD